MNQRRSYQIGTGLFILLGFAALAYLATQTTSVANFQQGPSYTLKAHFTNVGQLKLRAPVKIAGVRIGSVKAIDLDPTKLDATVQLSVDNRFNEVPDDSAAAIFTSGLLGDQYVAIQPGGSPTMLKDGDEFVLTQSSIQLEDLIGKFLVSGGPSKSGDQQIKLTWNAGGSDNGYPVTTYISVDGGGWQKVATTGSRIVGNGYNQTHSIRVKAVASPGGESLSPTYSATTSAPPSPKIWVTKGDYVSGCVNGCYKFKVNWENANLGSVTVKCMKDGGQVGNYAHPVTMNGTGSSPSLDCWQGSDNVNVWVDVVGWGDSVDTEKRYWAK